MTHNLLVSESYIFGLRNRPPSLRIDPFEERRERKRENGVTVESGTLEISTKQQNAHKKGFKENIRQNAHFLPVREKRVF